MATTYSDYVERIKTYLRVHEGDLDQLNMDECIQQAVEEHSNYRPYIQSDDISGDGSDPPDYALHADFFVDWSKVLMLEYPTGNNPRSLLDPEDWEIYYNGTAWRVRFLSSAPATGETARMLFTSLHTLTQDTDTLISTGRKNDFAAVCILSAAYCYDSLAAKFTQTQDPTMNQDVINYRTKGEEYNTLCNKMRKRYFALIGKSDKPQPEIAVATKDWDSEFAGQVDYLTHPKTYR
jgi:hypothetical protein